MVLDIMKERQLMAMVKAGTIQPRMEDIYDVARWNADTDLPRTGTPETFFSETQVGNPDGTVGERRLSISQKRNEGGGSHIMTNMDADQVIPTDWDSFLCDGIAMDVKCKELNLCAEILKRTTFEFLVENHRIARGLMELVPWGGGMTGIVSFQTLQSADPAVVPFVSGALGDFQNGTPDPRSVRRWGDNNRVLLSGKNALETRFRLDVYIDGGDADGALWPQINAFSDAANTGNNLHKVPDGTLTGINLDFEDVSVVMRARLMGMAFMKTQGPVG